MNADDAEEKDATKDEAVITAKVELISKPKSDVSDTECVNRGDSAQMKAAPSADDTQKTSDDQQNRRVSMGAGKDQASESRRAMIEALLAAEGRDGSESAPEAQVAKVTREDMQAVKTTEEKQGGKPTQGYNEATNPEDVNKLKKKDPFLMLKEEEERAKEEEEDRKMPARINEDPFLGEKDEANESRHQMITQLVAARGGSQMPPLQRGATQAITEHVGRAQLESSSPEPPVLQPTSRRRASSMPPIEPGAVPIRGINSSSLRESSKTLPDFVPSTSRNSMSQSKIKKEFGSSIWELEAAVVDEEADRKIILEELKMQMAIEAIPAENVSAEFSLAEIEQRNNRKLAIWGALWMLLAALAIGLGLGFGLKDKSNTEDPKVSDTIRTIAGNQTGDQGEKHKTISTLEVVRERGYVKCGSNDFSFGVVYDAAGELTGVFGDHCRAVAKLIFGDSSKVEFVHTAIDRFKVLENGIVDFLADGSTHTMGRDVHEPTSMSGLTFSTPWIYSGLAFAGNSSAFVGCADALDTFQGDCQDVKVCVLEHSTHMEILLSKMRGTAIHPIKNKGLLSKSLETGECNVIAAEPNFFATLPKGPDWTVGRSVLSKEPLALTTREDDPQWSRLVNLVVDGLIWAEANNFTKENAHEIADFFVSPDTSELDSEAQNSAEEFDSKLPSLLTSLVSEFGNYGDVYREKVEPFIPRSAINRPHGPSATEGLLYSIPFGSLMVTGPGPHPNGKMDAILARGHLICGLQSWRGSAFAARQDADNWIGFDAEYCRGIAAALFGGKPHVVFVELDSNISRHAALSPYAALRDDRVDVVAGARVSLQAQHHEPSTGQGYKFSTPYYFDTDHNNDAFAFMTRMDDAQWSDFVNWIVQGSIYATEEGITSSSSSAMPVVTLFGESLMEMFRHSISMMGSLDELWESTLQNHIPRTGANLVNKGQAGQLYPVPLV